jgi:hypothetical protein
VVCANAAGTRAGVNSNPISLDADIKGANILVDNNGTIKLTDFGAANQVAGMPTIERAAGGGVRVGVDDLLTGTCYAIL